MIRPLYRPNDADMTMSLTLGSPRRHRLSVSSSLTAVSRSSSPLFLTDLQSPPATATRSMTGRTLIRTASSSSLALSESGPGPIPQTFPEVSARHHLKPTKVSIDYTLPSTSTTTTTTTPTARLLDCSTDNLLFFTRGNRVYTKNLNSGLNEDCTPLFKLSESRGTFRALECGPKSHPHLLAIGTTQGYIQTWDIKTRKMILSFPTTKDISALAWNGAVLTVGGAKGTIKLYDTRMSPSEKMREGAKRMTRHQGRITCLRWNEDGRMLASGDVGGMVYCWEAGGMVPLNVGEFVQRRKKIQHEGAISVCVFCMREIGC